MGKLLLLLLALSPLIGAQNPSGGAPPQAPPAPAACPPAPLHTALTCPTIDHCTSAAGCARGQSCCPEQCGARCRCPAAVCAGGCGAGQRCVWQRGRTLCVPAPPTPVCTPACLGGQECRLRAVRGVVIGVCRAIDIDDFFESDDADDCFDDDIDDAFDDVFDDDDDDFVRFPLDLRTAAAASPQVSAAASAQAAVGPAVATTARQVRVSPVPQIVSGGPVNPPPAAPASRTILQPAAAQSLTPAQVQPLAPAQVQPPAPLPRTRTDNPITFFALRPGFGFRFSRGGFGDDDDRFDDDRFDDDRFDDDRFDDDRFDDDRFEHDDRFDFDDK